MITNQRIPKEGDLYKKLVIEGHIFELKYGYYEDFERNHPPVVIFPDLALNPLYTKDGYRLVTQIQDSCEHYTTAKGQEEENWCADCIHFSGEHKEIGICRHHKNKICLGGNSND